MFGFGKKEDQNRRAFREEFETTATRLRGADEAVQIAVGHSINMANSIFHQTHGTPARFQGLPKAEQYAYIEKLTDMENKLRDEMRDGPASLGFGLFKMWVGTLTAEDSELTGKFALELAYFSRKGDLSRP